MGNLFTPSLFYGNLFPRCKRKIDAAQGGCNIEGNLVLPAKNGKRICSYFICYIAVSCCPVSADNDEIYLSHLHKRACCAVRNKGDRYSLLHKFPCCQSCPLEHRSCLISKDLKTFALFPCNKHGRCCSTIASCCECTGIAVGKDSVAVFYKLCAPFTDCLVCLYVLFEYPL